MIKKICMALLTTTILFNTGNTMQAQDAETPSLGLPKEIEDSPTFKPIIKAITAFDASELKNLLSKNPAILEKVIEAGNEKTTVGNSLLALFTLMGFGPARTYDIKIMQIIKTLLDFTPKKNYPEYLKMIIESNDALPAQATIEILRYLADKNVKFNKEDTSKMLLNTPKKATETSSIIELMTYLLKNGADINYKGKTRSGIESTPLINHVDNEELVTFLINKGAKINEADEQKQTILHKAAIDGKKTLIEFLLKHGADINKKDQSGDTPFHIFIYCNLEKPILDIIKLFVAHGADITIPDEEGFTPLATLIAGFDETELVNRRRTKTISQKETDDSIAYLKQEMSKKMSAKEIEKQVKLGTKKQAEFAQKMAKEKHENDIWHAFRAAKNDLASLKELITTGKIAINTLYENAGDTLLHEAAASRWPEGSLERVKFLVEQGADTTIKNKQGLTPLAVAVANKPFGDTAELKKIYTDVVNYLKEATSKKMSAKEIEEQIALGEKSAS